MPTFAGPTDRIPFVGLLSSWTFDRGRTVYRSGGVWYEGTDIEWDVLAAADVVPNADRPGGEDWNDRQGSRYVFLGGRVYTVSNVVAAELAAGGFGAYLS